MTTPSTALDVSAFIDWISVTHKAKIAPVHDNLDKTFVPARGQNGYTAGKRYTTGVMEYWNPARPDMGVHIVYSGKVLAKIANDYGVSRDEILQFHTTLNGRVARIDFAVDIKNSGLDLNQLWHELENKNAITKSQHTRTQSGNNHGDTVYVGSRKSRKKLLRAYDKAKELGDFTADYIRVELETRSDVAKNASRLYQHEGYNAGTIIGMVKGFCDFPCVDSWNKCFMGDISKIPVGDKTIGNTEKWLLNQVSPALARVMVDNPEFFSVFIDDVKRNYEYIKKSEITS